LQLKKLQFKKSTAFYTWLNFKFNIELTWNLDELYYFFLYLIIRFLAKFTIQIGSKTRPTISNTAEEFLQSEQLI